jgi:rhodanese-related sulfurtransferase
MQVMSIRPERAYKLLKEGWTYLDVRTAAEFRLGHLRGAKNICFGEWDGDDLRENPRFLKMVEASFPNPKDLKLVVSCQTGGDRSVLAARQLGSKSFTKVLRMVEGFDGWRKRGLPKTRK